MSTVISDKIGFKKRNITEDKKRGYFVMIKGSINQENIVTNVYVPNSQGVKYMKKN